jgi:hypothetical protein
MIGDPVDCVEVSAFLSAASRLYEGRGSATNGDRDAKREGTTLAGSRESRTPAADGTGTQQGRPAGSQRRA